MSIIARVATHDEFSRNVAFFYSPGFRLQKIQVYRNVFTNFVSIPDYSTTGRSPLCSSSASGAMNIILCLSMARHKMKGAAQEEK